MAPTESTWEYAPHSAVATLTLIGGWVVCAIPLLIVFGALVFATPWDPDDLTPQMWLAQVDGYRETRTFALTLLAPLACLALITTIGGMLRRWVAPLVFAGGLWLSVGILALGATVGLGQEIEAGLAYAEEPVPGDLEILAPSAPTVTTTDIEAAVRDRLDRSLEAATGPVVFADAEPVSGADAIVIDFVACETGGSAAAVRIEIRTGDNVASEEAILSAWVEDGFTRDRAAGTNLLYGDETNAIQQGSLRGNSDGLLRLTIQSRCALS
ncbi:hypothetical protein [Microbacterium sp. A84]|uniref:hypothetical protein n=1 Tax=Microbacterium sp. A84 TaxID=3450715 RepID=UPI003F4257DB